MSVIKDLIIEAEDAVNKFEKNVRHVPVSPDTYDAFFDLKNIIDRLIGTSEYSPEHFR